MLKRSKETCPAGSINFVHSALFFSSVFYYHVYFVNTKKAPQREGQRKGERKGESMSALGCLAVTGRWLHGNNKIKYKII